MRNALLFMLAVTCDVSLLAELVALLEAGDFVPEVTA